MVAANNPSPFREILQLLETANSLNQLQWESTPDENEFRTQMNGGHIWFARYPEVPPGVFSQDATPGRFTITLVDYNNKLLDRLYPLTQEDVIEASQFFGMVRRKVLNLDHFYDSIRNDLKQKANQPA
jgi:hypothetical protein